MSTPINSALETLLNKCAIGEKVIMHMVPTRIIRMVQIGEGHTFRVEQLVEHGGFGGPAPKGEWRTLTTHHSEDKGAAIGAAFQAAVKAQQDLIYKLRKRMESKIQKVGGAPA
jgi:hypothetical protein